MYTTKLGLEVESRVQHLDTHAAVYMLLTYVLVSFIYVAMYTNSSFLAGVGGGGGIFFPLTAVSTPSK